MYTIKYSFDLFQGNLTSAISAASATCRCCTTSSSSKLPYNDVNCKGIRAAYVEYSRHWFRVLCVSNASSPFANQKFYLVKFTLADGRDDCKMMCDRAVEFEEDTLQRKGFWSIFGRSAEQLSKQAEKACRNKEGQDLKIPQVYKTSRT